MKISVIVPVYKVEKYLARCVDSILAQTFKDYELILVDDGSPDNCPKMCDEYAKKYDFIKVIHKENGGLSDARNFGIDYAMTTESEWITFIDSDDWVHPQYLEILYNACTENNVDISSCAYNVVYDQTEELRQVIYEIKKVSPEDYWCLTQSNAAISWGKIFKKSLFSGIRFPQRRINEDEFTTYKALFQCNYIVYLEAKLYYYFKNAESIMHSKWTLKKLDAFDAYKEQCEYFIKNGFLDAFKCSNRAYVWMIFYMFDELCIVPKKYKKYKRKVLKGWKNNFRIWRRYDLLKNNKNFRWPFESFYPIKIGIIDNVRDAIKQGGFKQIVINIKKHRFRKSEYKKQCKE